MIGNTSFGEGVSTDVREHARAVQILVETEVARAAFANARAALESAVDAAFLTREEELYTFRGAQARVSELFESEEIDDRSANHSLPLPADAPPRVDAETIIIDDAAHWDEEEPGAGLVLRRAWESYSKDRGAARKHWSLLPKEVLYRQVFIEPGNENLGDMADIIHALMSTAAHPRPRFGSRTVEFKDDGRVMIGTRPTDAAMARDTAAFACRIATHALQHRRTFAGAAI